MGDHPDRRRLPVRAGHRDDRDAGGRAGREERVDDGLGDVLRLALGRVGVHPEPGRGVDLDDPAARLADGRRDVRADEVDAGHVEPDDLCRGLGDLDVVRVGLDRAVDRRAAGRHVARQRELDPRAFGRDVVEPEALGADELLGRRVDPDPREHLLVADAAPRIGVRDLDELTNGVLRVGDDRGRDALGDRRDLAADDEAAVVVAGDVRLDDDVALAALSQGARIGRPNRFGRAQVEVDAAPVVAVERLDHARVADAARGGHRRLLVLDHLGPRDRQAGRVEQPVREALVGRDIDGDGRCPRGHRRADPLLVDAVAELDERMAVEPDERDVAAHRLVDQRLRRRPERPPFGERDQLLELVGEVEQVRWVGRRDEVVDEPDGHDPGADPDLLLAVLVDAVVEAGRSGGAGLAVAHVGAGQVLELERDVLGDVTHPRPVAQPRHEAAPPPERAGMVLERRDQRDQRVGEVRDRVRWELLEHAEVDEHPDDRLARPVVRPAQDARLDDAQGRFRARHAGRVRGSPARLRAVRVESGLPPGDGRRLGHGLPLAGGRFGDQLDAASRPGSAWRAGVAIRWRRRRSKR